MNSYIQSLLQGQLGKCRTGILKPKGGTPDFKWKGWQNGGKNPRGGGGGGGGGVLPYKDLMGTCGQPGYVFRDFCLKQGIEFIIFCLHQGIDLSIFVLNRISFLGQNTRTKQQNFYKL